MCVVNAQLPSAMLKTLDGKTINVKSKVKFPRSSDYANYTIAYAVAADGLAGTSNELASKAVANASPFTLH